MTVSLTFPTAGAAFEGRILGGGKVKILILGATFGTGNMGVGALAAGALTIVARNRPEAKVQLLDYGKQPMTSRFDVSGKMLEVPSINLRFSWKLFLPNNVASLVALAVVAKLAGAELGGRLIKANRWLAAIDEADLALAVSGGDSFSDIYGLGRFFYVGLPQALVAILGKRLVLLPQTIGPFKGRVARLLAGVLLRKASLVYSRDRDSLDEIRLLRGDDASTGGVRFCPDMAFVIEPHAPKSEYLGTLKLVLTEGVAPLVGLNISGLLLMGGYTRSNMFGLRVSYAGLVDRLIRYFVEERNASVLLVPHVFGDEEESDAAASETVLGDKYAGRLLAVRGSYDQNEIKHIIGRCDFFVGSRMHACIAALSQCIPAVGVAYSDKFTGVFSSIGAARMVVDARRLSLDQISREIAEAFDARAATRLQLEEQMPQIKRQVMGLLDDLGRPA